jgi:hypothetical protein
VKIRSSISPFRTNIRQLEVELTVEVMKENIYIVLRVQSKRGRYFCGYGWPNHHALTKTILDWSFRGIYYSILYAFSFHSRLISSSLPSCDKLRYNIPTPGTAQSGTQAQENHRLGCGKIVQRVE